MSGSTWIFVAFVVVMLIAVIFGLYTRGGSGINQRPYGRERGDGASGAAGPSRLSSSEDETEGVPDTHGTA
jgi:hypothetical protein